METTLLAAIEKIRKEYQLSHDISWGQYLVKRQELIATCKGNKPEVKALVPVAVKPTARPANDGVMAAWSEIR